MKKRMVILLLCVILMAALPVGISAEDAVQSRTLTALLATTAPTIDGTVDDVWADAMAIRFQNLTTGEAVAGSYIKLMWSTDGTYILGVMKGQTDCNLAITEKKWTVGNAAYWWESAAWNLKITSDGVRSGVDGGYASGLPDDTVKTAVKADENGFVFEVFFPHRGKFAYQDGHQIGFVAHYGGPKGADYVTEQVQSGFNWHLNASLISAVTLVNENVPCQHDWAEATCLTKKTCRLCGEVDESTSLNPENHAGEKVFADNGDGTHSEKWSCCGKVLSTENHTYGEVIVDKQPTCTEVGTGSKFCTACNNRCEMLNLDPLGHDFDKTEMIIDKEPTCTEAGSKSYHCKREGCDGKDSVTAIDALGHIPGDWKTLTAATCSKKGEEYRTCTRCWDTVETREVAMLAHTATEWIVDKEAAPGVSGKRHQQCTVCGALFNEEVIEALPVEKKGCGAVISASALGIYAAAALAVGAVWKRKKKKG